jgi:ketosteroid isomerase-like protein
MTATEALVEVCTAWDQLDPTHLASLFTPDGVYEDPLKPTTLHGVDDIRDGNAPAMAALTTCRVTITTTVADETVAFAEGEFRSTLAQGGRLDFPFAILVEMDQGRIRRVAEYFDTAPLIP